MQSRDPDHKQWGEHARAGLRRVRAEWWALRHLGWTQVLRAPLERRAAWWRALPAQRPRRVRACHFDRVRAPAPSPPLSGATHAVYLPPEPFARALPELAGDYPSGVGLKLCKRAGGLRQRYLSTPGPSWIHDALTYDPAHMTLVANLLARADLGPRLFDLIELDCEGVLHVGYVVEHVDGREPSVSECARGLERLRELEARGRLRVSALRGYDSVDFACPGCNGNAWIERSSGSFRYVDFQNFWLLRYREHLESLRSALSHAEAIDAPHRSPDVLVAALAPGEAGLDGVVVLDLAGSPGLAVECLRRGAHWVHVPDLPPSDEAWLLAQGCTRFSGGALSELPSFAHGRRLTVLLRGEPRSPLRSLWKRAARTGAWERGLWIDAPEPAAARAWLALPDAPSDAPAIAAEGGPFAGTLVLRGSPAV